MARAEVVEAGFGVAFFAGELRQAKQAIGDVSGFCRSHTRLVIPGDELLQLEVTARVETGWADQHGEPFFAAARSMRIRAFAGQKPSDFATSR